MKWNIFHVNYFSIWINSIESIGIKYCLIAYPIPHSGCRSDWIFRFRSNLIIIFINTRFFFLAIALVFACLHSEHTQLFEWFFTAHSLNSATFRMKKKRFDIYYLLIFGFRQCDKKKCTWQHGNAIVQTLSMCEIRAKMRLSFSFVRCDVRCDVEPCRGVLMCLLRHVSYKWN